MASVNKDERRREGVSKSNDQDQSERLGGIQQGSNELGENSNWPDQIDSQRRASDITFISSREIIGGILSRVMRLEEKHTAYVKSHESRLKARLGENQVHQQEVFDEVQHLKADIQKLLEAFEADEALSPIEE